MSTAPPPSSWDLAQLLSESTRRRLFDAVRSAGRPMTRDEIAELTGVNRRLAAFHLDRLAAAGALAVDFARPPGRTGGPGSGRPSKRYATAPMEFAITVPPRRYDLAARVLAAGITARPDDAANGAAEAAEETGRTVGAGHQAPAGASLERRAAGLCAALSEIGYEPTPLEGEEIRTANCPFRSVADQAPDLVCKLNHRLITGMVAGAAAGPAEVRLEPQEAPACCITVRMDA